jgi:hypothetical protein
MKVQLFPSLSVLAAMVLMFSMEAAHAEDMIAKAYDIKDVSELVVSGGGRVQILQGQTESLRVEATKDVMDRVRVDLSGGKLDLSVRHSAGKGFNFFDLFKHRNDDVLYILQLKNINYLGLSGASRATIGNWVGGDMRVNVSGAGAANFTNLRVDDLFVELTGASNSQVQILAATKAKFELSGAANMEVKGASNTSFLKVGASGASNFKGKLLTAAQADIDASGASNIDLHATEFLKAGASGASNIRYLGQPKLDSNVSGASNVKPFND